MSKETAKVTLHMVCSIDGFIAKKDMDVSWMDPKTHYPDGIELSEEYIADFLQTVDCYIMGSRTYEHTLEVGWPYGDKPVYVFTKRKLHSQKESVEFLNGSLEELTNSIKRTHNNIWMVGGSALTRELLRLNLVDNIVITIAPVILGEGIPFFDNIGREISMELMDHMVFKNGMVELNYRVNH
ncbi:dihydrofolate reductase family protein [Muriicola marianensis]|uniref:Dihydrofolate reductase n=1 Tax=Muriicola marianensis TaxID=1324801 RepID=A0ABQ1R260_9FLAO|nr:dihydrofolate reductase family protein [Muriicola marianensis]GGD53402.1 dihydrofolate reductase [Muriicola marianensis]